MSMGCNILSKDGRNGWKHQLVLLFTIHVRTDSGSLEECKCAMMETLWDYCPGQTRSWWPSTVQIGTKMLYKPGPDPVVYVVPISHILGRLPLVPAGDTGTIPHSMRDRKAACYEHGLCDRDGEPGSGSSLFYINLWAMIWPTDHGVAPGWQGQREWPFAVCDSVKTKSWKECSGSISHVAHLIIFGSCWIYTDITIYWHIYTYMNRYWQQKNAGLLVCTVRPLYMSMGCNILSKDGRNGWKHQLFQSIYIDPYLII